MMECFGGDDDLSSHDDFDWWMYLFLDMTIHFVRIYPTIYFTRM